MFHVFHPLFGCFKQEGVYGPCYFVLVRSEVRLKQPLRCGQMNTPSVLRTSVSLDTGWEMAALLARECLSTLSWVFFVTFPP